MLEALPQKEPHRRDLTLLWCPRMTHSMAQIWRKGTRNCRGCWHMLPSSWFWICHATFCKCMVSPTPADWLVQWLSVPWYIRNGNHIPTFSCRYLPFQYIPMTQSYCSEKQRFNVSLCPHQPAGSVLQLCFNTLVVFSWNELEQNTLTWQSGQIIIFHQPELRPFGDHFPY